MAEYEVRMAAYFLKLGITPIPLERNKRNPNKADWTETKWTSEAELEKPFSGDVNVGVLLGAPSNNHIDIDLDVLEAVKLAPLFLPPTGLTWGRASKPASHWLYRVTDGEVRGVKFNDPMASRTSSTSGSRDKPVLLEIRGDGHQTMCPPSRHPEGEIVQFYSHEAPAEVGIEDLRRRCGFLAAASFLAKYWGYFGSRHELTMHLAGALQRSGWSEEDADKFITNIAQAANDEEIEDRRRVIRDTFVKAADDDPTSGWPTLRNFIGEDLTIHLRKWLGIQDIVQFPLNDMGNAQRLLKLHGEDIRFCTDQRVWYVWDGRKWCPDLSETMVGSRVLSIQRAIFQEAAEAADKDYSTALAKWAISSGNISRITAVPRVAQDISSTWIKSNDLDWDKYKINVHNGVLNLVTGGLERPHNKGEFITKIAGTSYNIKAAAPRFSLFLEQIFNGNDDLIRFIQKLAGYSLTASTQEQIFPILHGSGANGKSTLLEILRAMMGDYCQVADATTFLQQNTDKIRSDLARLSGARMVTSSEVSANRKLDTAMVKAITGGDPITARFLFKNDFEYIPGYKIWMATNYKPVIEGDDDAAFRRIRLIPFEIKIPPEKQDSTLKNKIIETELPGVLAWAVEGCMMWMREGLGQPSKVVEATNTYKENSDTVALFIHSECSVGDEFRTSGKNLYSAYQVWCKASGERYVNLTQFKDKLIGLGFHLTSAGWARIGLINGVPTMVDDVTEPILDKAYERSPFNP